MPESLKAQVLARVGAWFDAAAIRLRDDHMADAGQLTITLNHPGGDDDGTLCLEATVTEKTHLGIEGRVEGVMFDADDAEDGETQG